MKARKPFAYIATFLLIATLITVIPASASPANLVGSADDKVTGQTYVRYDGGTDQAIQDCNNHDPAVFGVELEGERLNVRTSDFAANWPKYTTVIRQAAGAVESKITGIGSEITPGASAANRAAEAKSVEQRAA